MVCVYLALALFPGSVWASVGGSIAGTVRDAHSAAIPGAEVSAEETSTGLHYAARSDKTGRYSFPVLPPGRYRVKVSAGGFAQYQREGVVLDIHAALAIDAALAVGSVRETVSVRDDTLHVETTSTQLGEVLQGKQIAAIPLNGRSYTDLLSLQPGVAPGTSITTANVDDLGAQILNPSGTLNPGTISVNGQREFANFFTVNGSDVEEDVNAGAAIVPNLDAIAEFRIITSNFDAQYGEFSGGQISVVTRSGTNGFHGSAFEFLRNTALDAKNYFSQERGVFRQNQFGGTFGGPLKRNRAFFFADYQGTRQTQGVDTGDESVPSLADRQGDLSDVAGNLTGSVHGPYLAGLLAGKLGYGVQDGELYYAPGCTESSQCVFPNAIVPKTAWSAPAQKLIGYVPAPNNARGKFSTSAFDQTVQDDKEALRVDAKTRAGLLSAYYFLDNYTLNDPYPVAQSGASVPGFSALNTGRAQMLMLGATTLLGSHTVNELRGSFLRDKNDLGQPVGGVGVSLASQGFTNADGSSSIVALDPRGQSVENVDFNGFSIGAAANELLQVNNIFQVSDDFSRVLGAHTFKVGGEFHSDQVNDAPVAQFNGNFIFSGNESGSDFVDFLIGVPSQYNQSQLNPFYARQRYLGLYAQDSWHVRSNLTLNYGLRWDRIAPWTEKHNEISTFVPGEQSVVFPGGSSGNRLSRRSRHSVDTGRGTGVGVRSASRRGVVAGGEGRYVSFKGAWQPRQQLLARQLWAVLYRDRCVDDWRACGERSVWHDLHQSLPAAVRDPVCFGRYGSERGSAVSVYLCAAELFAATSRYGDRLEHVRADQRHTGVRPEEPHALYRGVDAVVGAAGWTACGAGRDVCGKLQPSAARAAGGEPW